MATTVESAGSGRTVVLVADDDVHINALITRLLLREGFDVVRAPDGQEAIEQIDARQIDLLVLDLMMPRVDGFGVIEHLKTARPELLQRTIVVTAFPESDALPVLRAVCGVLSKPFDTAVLLAAVRDCVSR